MMNRSINLQCVLTRTVKKLKVLICGQRSQQWICSQGNQQYNLNLKKKQIPLCSDKNCQSTICYRKKSPVRPMYANDKNCQETQCVQMQPEKSRSNMQSVTKLSVMRLPIPARKQSNHKKCKFTKCLCDDKN